MIFVFFCLCNNVQCVSAGYATLTLAKKINKTWMTKDYYTTGNSNSCSVCSGLTPEFNVQAKTWLLQLKKGGKLVALQDSRLQGLLVLFKNGSYTYKTHCLSTDTTKYSDLKQSTGYPACTASQQLLHALSAHCAIQQHSALLSNTTTSPLDTATCATDNIEPHPTVMQFVVN